jgi:hypothetical protein
MGRQYVRQSFSSDSCAAGDFTFCLQHYAPVCRGKRHRAVMSNSANRAQRCHIVLGADDVVNRARHSRENQACILLHIHAPRILTDSGDRGLSVLLPRTLNPWFHGFHVTFRIGSSNPAVLFSLATAPIARQSIAHWHNKYPFSRQKLPRNPFTRRSLAAIRSSFALQLFRE